MAEAIVLFPKFKGLEIVQKIRKKYDPQYKLVKPHITLVFPFNKDFSNKILDQHIKESIKKFKPFEIRLKGIKKSSKEYYLYLVIEKGNKAIIDIHTKLYSKLLGRWLRKDISYIPHITIGIFKTKREIDDAVKSIKEESLDFSCTIDSVYLLDVEDNLVKLKSAKRYKF